MTVASPAYRAGPYAGDGVSTIFPIDFYFLEDSHIAVFRRGLDGVDRRLTLGVDYSIDGAGDEAGGSATLTAPLLGGETLAIIRDVPLTQEVEYPEGGRFPARTHERALDKITMTLQQLREAVGRAVLLTPGSAAVDVIIPDPAAGLPLGWDPAGSGNLVNLQALGGWKGEWATGTVYDAGDIVKNAVTGNLYVARVAHVSDTTLALDVTAGNLLLAIDVEAVTAARVAAEAAQSTAETAETNAAASEGAASAAASAAGGSAGAAASDAAAAGSSAAAASGSATAATAAQAAAETARDKAQDWAETPEDVAVDSGVFSAKHHAAKAAASAMAAADSAADAAADAASLTFASQAEAEAGTDNTKGMTPLRTAEAIAALAPTGGGGAPAWGDLTGTLSDQTDLQTALDGKRNAADQIETADIADNAISLSKIGPNAYVTKAQAEAGVNGVGILSPLLTAQAITALAPAAVLTGATAIEVVAALPGTPDPNTIYLVTA